MENLTYEMEFKEQKHILMNDLLKYSNYVSLVEFEILKEISSRCHERYINLKKQGR